MNRPLRVVLFVTIFLSCVAVQRAQSNLDQRVSELSQKISNGLTENRKRTIAVVEFADLRGNVTDFGRFIAEELITKLYETSKFKVIERQLLNRVIAEQKLSLTGIVDPASAQKLGRLLGVDAIASGTITDLGKSLRINARLIDTGTAEIFAVASTEIVKDDAVTRLVGGGDSSLAQTEGPNRAGPQQGKSKSQTVEAQFFTFELHRCRLSGTTVACDLTITNNDRDRELAICSRSAIFDEAGNRYKMHGAQLANVEGSTARAHLISGVATKARVTFERVSPTAIKITLMSLEICGVQGGRSFQLQYRNVPLRDGVVEVENQNSAHQVATVNIGCQEMVRVDGNQQWTDSGIDVWTGRRLEVVTSGRVYITNQNPTSSQILGSLINKGTPVSHNVGTNALLAKIRYARGGESKILRVGNQNTSNCQEGEVGRLLLGVDDKNVKTTAGILP